VVGWALQTDRRIWRIWFMPYWRQKEERARFSLSLLSPVRKGATEIRKIRKEERDCPVNSYRKSGKTISGVSP